MIRQVKIQSYLFNHILQIQVFCPWLGVTIVLAVVGALLICIFVERTVKFRLSGDMGTEGLDQSLHGEHGYDIIG
ncbi:MAG: ammonium transporter [Deltaproteobacteria bacterium]|nr:ammonium transporter [Deltaproteobacteria bacterium]